MGKKYAERELAALIYPLDIILDTLKFCSVRDVVNEPILQQMEEDELIFGLAQVFQALLTDLPVPEGEHPGYQEALIAELLQQMYGAIELECLSTNGGDALNDYDPGSARRAAWSSFVALCHPDAEGASHLLPLVKRLGLDLSDAEVYLSSKLTRDRWEEIVVTGGLFDVFLWDTDWRMETFLDLPEESTSQTRELMGYDLDTVHRLPPRPSSEELEEARSYLRHLGKSIEGGD